MSSIFNGDPLRLGVETRPPNEGGYDTRDPDVFPCVFTCILGSFHKFHVNYEFYNKKGYTGGLWRTDRDRRELQGCGGSVVLPRFRTSQVL